MSYLQQQIQKINPREPSQIWTGVLSSSLKLASVDDGKIEEYA